MAQLIVENDEVVLRLSGFEKAESLHGDLRLPLAAVKSVEVVDNALSAVHGFRSPGTGVPGLLAVGTYRQQGRKTFAVVHMNFSRGVRVQLGGADYDELIVSCADPEDTAATLHGLLAH